MCLRYLVKDLVLSEVSDDPGGYTARHNLTVIVTRVKYYNVATTRSCLIQKNDVIHGTVLIYMMVKIGLLIDYFSITA